MLTYRTLEANCVKTKRISNNTRDLKTRRIQTTTRVLSLSLSCPREGCLRTALIVSSKDAFPTAAPEIVANTHFQQLHRERSSKTKNHGVRRRTTTTPHVLRQIRWNKSAFSGIFRRRRPLLLQRCKKHKEIAIETQTKNVRGRDDTR